MRLGMIMFGMLVASLGMSFSQGMEKSKEQSFIEQIKTNLPGELVYLIGQSMLDKQLLEWCGSLGALTLSHGGSVQSASFSGDGSKVVTASDDRTAKIWDISWQKSLSFEQVQFLILIFALTKLVNKTPQKLLIDAQSDLSQVYKSFPEIVQIKLKDYITLSD